jgi:hypothetical protein
MPEPDFGSAGSERAHMSKAETPRAEKAETLKPRLPRGFVDRRAEEIAAQGRMLETIRRSFELYGFEALETPFVEYTEALGKFLPDLDRPNAGVFSFQDDDEAWLSLRYDLTAPLAATRSRGRAASASSCSSTPTSSAPAASRPMPRPAC